MILDCIVKAIFLLLIYNVLSLILFGVPKSMSSTYYSFKERMETLKVLFPGSVLAMVIFLTPAMVQITSNSPLIIISILYGMTLGFVGVVPFLRDKNENSKLHRIASGVAILLSFLWIIFVTPYWYIIPTCLVIFLTISIVTKTFKKGYWYWLENTSLTSIFMSTLIYYELYIK